jgi:hypothetical protein
MASGHSGTLPMEFVSFRSAMTMIDPINGKTQMTSSCSDFCSEVATSERASRIVATIFGTVMNPRTTEVIAIDMLLIWENDASRRADRHHLVTDAIQIRDKLNCRRVLVTHTDPYSRALRQIHGALKVSRDRSACHRFARAVNTPLHPAFPV